MVNIHNLIPHGSSTSNITYSTKIKFNSLFFRKEVWNKSSISLLMNSGINFEKLAESGIDHTQFAEHFITSGLIMNKDVHWYGFHTDHDFAYLLRILTGQPIPSTESQFLSDLSLIFPNFYDIKVIADQSLGLFRGSLASLSERLGVLRDDDCEH